MSDEAGAVVRLNQIGAGLTRRLSPEAQARADIAGALDLAALNAFDAELTLVPADGGWRLDGHVVADAVQSCGLTLEPLPVRVDERFSVHLVETATDDSQEVVLDPLAADEGSDVIEDGRIDLLQYAVEHLALSLDPFPRKPGAVFTPPEQPGEISPFAVLQRLRAQDGGDPD